MAPAVDDYDESYDALDDALNEELSAIESDLIRLNSRSWPKPEDGEDARGARRFRDGAEAERAEVGALDGREDGAVEAAAWMTRAEDAMVRGAREEGAVSTGTASGSFARAETRRDATPTPMNETFKRTRVARDGLWRSCSSVSRCRSSRLRLSAAKTDC